MIESDLANIDITNRRGCASSQGVLEGVFCVLKPIRCVETKLVVDVRGIVLRPFSCVETKRVVTGRETGRIGVGSGSRW